MPQKYKIATLLDVARLPKEAWPRFIKELPEMLGMIREMDKFVEASAEALPEEQREEAIKISQQSIIDGLEWIDDGHEHFDMNLRGQDMEGKEHLVMKASTREREVSAISDGKDITHDILLVRALRDAGFPMDEDGQDILSEGELRLTSYDLGSFKDITPQGLAEMCVSANRKLVIDTGGKPVSDAWRDAADQIIE